MKKIQKVIEINPLSMKTNLPKLNDLLENGWLVKQVVVCFENAVHYLIEKVEDAPQKDCITCPFISNPRDPDQGIENLRKHWRELNENEEKA